eukprot:TRINITY_DN50308_c0_g1_i1.p1 TRINITY_DN50308_c0_g1~~TRINITY_DN50308_c0_g1_i1.p1  ORF type:complete len:425 (+),score=124.68 TRINITY_DN50308_c0_g1_i1:76-1350(+)
MRLAAALALAVAAPGGLASWLWEPQWQPGPPWEQPSSRCVNKYAERLLSTASEYVAGCLQDNVLERVRGNVSDCPQCGAQIRQVPGDMLRLVGGHVSLVNRCAWACFNPGGPLPTGARWLNVVWLPSDGLCTCLGQLQVPDELADPEERPPDCGRKPVLLRVPLGCLFQGKEQCIAAPGPPDGCIWTMDACCVDAKGYEWPAFFWPPPWWVWASLAMLLATAAAGVVLGFSVRHFTAARARDPFGHDPAAAAVDGALRRRWVAAQKVAFEDLLESMQAAPAGCDNEDGASCCICLEELATGVLVQLQCAHRLHHKCMREYVMHNLDHGERRPRCPSCRERIRLPAAACQPDGGEGRAYCVPSDSESEGGSAAGSPARAGRGQPGPAPGSGSPAAAPPPPLAPRLARQQAALHPARGSGPSSGVC